MAIQVSEKVGAAGIQTPRLDALSNRLKQRAAAKTMPKTGLVRFVSSTRRKASIWKALTVLALCLAVISNWRTGGVAASNKTAHVRPAAANPDSGNAWLENAQRTADKCLFDGATYSAKEEAVVAADNAKLKTNQTPEKSSREIMLSDCVAPDSQVNTIFPWDGKGEQKASHNVVWPLVSLDPSRVCAKATVWVSGPRHLTYEATIGADSNHPNGLVTSPVKLIPASMQATCPDLANFGNGSDSPDKADFYFRVREFLTAWAASDKAKMGTLMAPGYGLDGFDDEVVLSSPDTVRLTFGKPNGDHMGVKVDLTWTDNRTDAGLSSSYLLTFNSSKLIERVE